MASKPKVGRKPPAGGVEAAGGLLNLGPVSREWLAAVGVRGRAGLEKTGAVEAFRRVEAAGSRPSVNLLYALHAALLDLHWTMLPPKVRGELKRKAGREP